MAADNSGRPVWAEVDVSAIRRNVENLKALLAPGVKFCAVVKADGYGHGAVPAAREAVRAGADFLAVAILDEALHLRDAGLSQPILILGYTPPEQATLAAGAGVSLTIYSLEQAATLSAAGTAAGKKVPVHLKIDTGMNRLGVRPEDAPRFAAAVSALPGVTIEGAFTHFACADAADKDHARRQYALFQDALTAIAARGIHIPIRHAANSAALLDMPETHLDMVRAGLALYGLWPSAETTRPVELHPAMRLKALVAMVKNVPEGSAIGYGRTYRTPAPATIATLPLGYADGWARRLGNRAEALVRGRRVRVVGRVCMDQCMLDVTGIDGVREGDVALLFGGPEIPVEEVAALLDTINYEVVCMVGKRVPRRYVNADDFQ